MKNEKLYVVVYFYIFTFYLSMLIRNPLMQNIILIFSLLLLNYIIIIKCKITNKALIAVSIITIIFNVVLIYMSYVQIFKLGFNDGLVNGYVFNINYSDDYNYYYESEILKNYWINGDFMGWLHGVAPSKMFYGYYNIFVIYNAILKILIGNNLISLILLKLQFTVGSVHLVYLIAKKYINYKTAIIPVILMNLFPAYIQTNISLIRDNLILFFSLLVVYEIAFKKENLFRLSIYTLILICLRSYVALPIVLIAITYRYLILEKVKIKNITLYFVIILICVLCIGIFLQMQGYGFLGLELLKKIGILGDTGQGEEKVISLLKNLGFDNLRFIFFGNRFNENQYFSPFIYDWLLGLSYIFIPIFCLPTLLIFISRNKCIRQFNNLIFVIAFIINGLVLYVFGWNVPRLYLPWIWGHFILFAYLVEWVFKHLSINLIIVLMIFYGCFITTILKFYIK